MKTYAVITLVTAASLLSGCNSEPSEQDIYTAMNKVVAQANAFVKSIAGKDVPKDALRELKSVKKHDCVEVSDQRPASHHPFRKAYCCCNPCQNG